jgi:hypothetical protein
MCATSAANGQIFAQSEGDVVITFFLRFLPIFGGKNGCFSQKQMF